MTKYCFENLTTILFRRKNLFNMVYYVPFQQGRLSSVVKSIRLSRLAILESRNSGNDVSDVFILKIFLCHGKYYEITEYSIKLPVHLNIFTVVCSHALGICAIFALL